MSHVSMFQRSGLFIQLDNLDSNTREFILNTLVERTDPLQILQELEVEAIERGYKDVHELIDDLKSQTGET